MITLAVGSLVAAIGVYFGIVLWPQRIPTDRSATAIQRKDESERRATTGKETHMDAEDPPRAMGYVCIDLVKIVTGVDCQARKVAARLGYEYAGLCRSNSLIVPEALLDHITTHRIELLIVPNLMHLRGRMPADLADLTDIHDLAANRTYEREGAYAPDEGHSPNPLAAP